MRVRVVRVVGVERGGRGGKVWVLSGGFCSNCECNLVHIRLLLGAA